MTISIKQQELLFAPDIISNLINIFKDRVLDIKDRRVFSSLHKMVSIAFDESLTMKNYFSNAKIELNIEQIKDIDFDKIYDNIEKTEENLWLLYNKFENSTDIYEIQLFDLIDNTLDNFAKINNILGYFESQIIQSTRESN